MPAVHLRVAIPEIYLQQGERTWEIQQDQQKQAREW
jgi:hypothetical protein